MRAVTKKDLVNIICMWHVTKRLGTTMAGGGESALRAIIAPSMLSCDFSRLKDESERMITAGADWLHMDVMVSILLDTDIISMFADD